MAVKNKKFTMYIPKHLSIVCRMCEQSEKTDDMIQYEKVDGDGGVRRIDLFDAGVFSCCQYLEDLAHWKCGKQWLNR